MNKKNEALKMAIISFEAIMKAGLEDTQAEILQCKKALEKPAWQGLTDDEIDYWECLKAPPVHPDFLEDDNWREFARCIEKALKDKNT